ncbi:two component transcriptional regulator, LytTR family [Anaerocolumna jejuensis DSM 15929]|uniref:Stage 0 sporulation protein A homolog n=1 Tax=Anaerocolumna jejuensis DSM 15929 TaxID=1121322 RepID=A0A1M7B310_9FIRM|nr:LytTR family DNA-binding domain-containing protein [Anaerocolumna jejuensis]SHL49385.1 two component transcriptional regulator, LytTR family [Anaerocolumna jejuensis DSM 15929]
MVSIAICGSDSASNARIENIIESECSKYNINIGIDMFYSGEALEKGLLMGERYDLLYLDISMTEKGGIRTVKRIRRMDEHALIICVSEHEKDLAELFRFNVFDFVKRPMKEEDFIISFLAAYERICNEKIYYHYRYKNAEYKVLSSEILYFESRGRQIHMHLLDKKVEVFNAKLDQVATQLECGKIPFLRIHKSYLVNYHQVKAYSKTKLVMLNGQELRISEERQKDVEIIYSRLLGD